MRDWRADIRARLADGQLDPASEAEIIEEVAQHLEDQFGELRARGTRVELARQRGCGSEHHPSAPSVTSGSGRRAARRVAAKQIRRFAQDDTV